MTLTQLNYILAVDRCRNFAQAAKECFVTQPTLSMQIQKLEEYLQITIFDRTKTPVTPTPMGKRVLENAQRVIKAAQELEELSKSLRGEISGEFILGVIPTLAPYVLPLFVHEFVENYPKVDLKIYEYQTEELIRLLKDGKIDGAILAAPLEVKEINEKHLFFEPFKIFLSPAHPLLTKKNLDEKDLNLQEAWLLKEGHCLRAQALQLCHVMKTQGHRHLFFEAGSLETLINMVKTSRGFTVLPYLSTINLSPSDQRLVKDFKNHVPVRDICFATGPYAMKKSIEEKIVKIIGQNIPKDLRKISKKSEILPIQ
jgi:LysR family hydrogen peroxide-inducible transcriptional activator